MDLLNKNMQNKHTKNNKHKAFHSVLQTIIRFTRHCQMVGGDTGTNKNMHEKHQNDMHNQDT